VLQLRSRPRNDLYNNFGVGLHTQSGAFGKPDSRFGSVFIDMDPDNGQESALCLVAMSNALLSEFSLLVSQMGVVTAGDVADPAVIVRHESIVINRRAAAYPSLPRRSVMAERLNRFLTTTR